LKIAITRLILIQIHRLNTRSDSIHLSYILWAEQTFPKGGPESNLTKLLERCASLFKDEEKYRNDERYIYVWMKMVFFYI